MLGEEIRWISARGVGDDSAIHDRQMFGIFLNVTDRKQAEEGHELLAGEMSHRVKNLLAIATGLTNFTSQSTTTAKENGQGTDRAPGSPGTRPRSGAPTSRKSG